MRQFSKHHLLLQIIKDQIQQIEAAIISQQTQTSLKRLQDVLKRWRRLTTKSDVLTTSGRGRLICDVLKTSDSRRLGDVGLRRLEDVLFTTSWKRLIYDILKTSVYVLLKTSDVRCLEDVCFIMSWRCPIYDVLKTSVEPRLCCNVVATSTQCRKKWFFLILYCLKHSENFKSFCLG